ncbi:hypothetical protein Pmani_038580 [Petrolisthes manimaculis]|uniref:Uncharacterized protein n=1 Tax=Petrolisthes manimaculis TaxID=1843537 RepID=A0AAE1NFE0_9EUCA|nr:hypothetical protein Pmani_038580 [Petrolisthes manimaculis]
MQQNRPEDPPGRQAWRMRDVGGRTGENRCANSMNANGNSLLHSYMASKRQERAREVTQARMQLKWNCYTSQQAQAPGNEKGNLRQERIRE